MGKYGFDQISNHRSIQHDDVLAQVKEPRNRGFLPEDLEGHGSGCGVGLQVRKLSKGFSVDLDMLHNRIIPNR